MRDTPEPLAVWDLLGVPPPYGPDAPPSLRSMFARFWGIETDPAVARDGITGPVPLPTLAALLDEWRDAARALDPAAQATFWVRRADGLRAVLDLELYHPRDWEGQGRVRTALAEATRRGAFPAGPDTTQAPDADEFVPVVRETRYWGDKTRIRARSWLRLAEFAALALLGIPAEYRGDNSRLEPFEKALAPLLETGSAADYITTWGLDSHGYASRLTALRQAGNEIIRARGL